MHHISPHAQIHSEITRENRSVRQQYVSTFAEEAQDFANVMGDTLSTWLEMYTAVQGDERRMKVLALGYTSISLHVGSMKLLFSGHQIASGNMMRQVLEAIALTLLCTEKDSIVFDRFESNEYSTKNAITDVKRNADKLKVKKAALATLEASQKFYSRFSHPSKMTIGTLDSFAGEGVYLGAAFDPGKEKYYRTEVSNRIKLAKQFPGFLKVIQRNLAAW